MAKRCFEGFLHTSRPDFKALYGIDRLDFVSRTNLGLGALWTDDTALPPTAWYDATASSYTNDTKHLLLDIETWPAATQAERLATAAKFVTVYQEMKTRMPDYQIGFYAYTPRRDFFRATEIVDEKAIWQAENDDFAVMYAAVDFFAPALYFFYTRDQEGQAGTNPTHAHEYFHENLVELKRCRTAYGRNQPIYPYVWYRRHDDAADLDMDVWVDMCQTAYLEGDGLILWGGYQEAWADNTTWWGRFLKDFPFGDRTVIKPRAVRN